MQDLFAQRSFTTSSPEETEALGRELAGGLKAGDVVGLTGELGSGKTCFVQGLAKGLGITGYTKSPSFTIVNVYEGGRGGKGGKGGKGGRLPLYHIDLFRVGGGAELDGLGLEEYIYGEGVSVIEWADRAIEILPERAIVVRFSYKGETERSIEFERRGA